MIYPCSGDSPTMVFFADTKPALFPVLVQKAVYTKNRIYTNTIKYKTRLTRGFLVILTSETKVKSLDLSSADLHLTSCLTLSLSHSLLDSARLPTDREGKLDYNRLAAVTTTGCKMIQLGGWDCKTD